MSGGAKALEFVSFCIEMYAGKYEISGSLVARQFEDYGVLDYLFENYDALHTQGWGYILPLIDDYIGSQKQNKIRS
ncbi:MAG: DUF3791 domain-containing protein [Planctomycetaceae bacterium]|jgi:hypothetical protein|nr:DUF3791 domain-containing protein [Planctomycetaceae bacterium]